jgi:hypothetical protein
MSLLKVECNPHTSCGYHRLALPFSLLECEPKVPIFVFNRLPECAPRGLEALRAKDIKIIMDIDDYWALPDTHYLYPNYMSEMTSVRIRMSLERADLVMATNSYLADRVRPVNKNIVIVPNALPFDLGQFKPGPSVSDCSFVYAAGPSHYEDIASVREQLDAPDVTLAGVDFNHPEWKRIIELVPNARTTGVRPIGDYMQAYDRHSVALGPLIDTPFNRCKSNLKMLEAGARNLPFIASRNSPYHYDDPLVGHCGVLLAGDLDEWSTWMDTLRLDRNFRERVGVELGQYVRERFQLADANLIRKQIIESFQ